MDLVTDMAARGIHMDGIDLVIHADPPTEHKAYVHRSGRTARNGADGAVVTVQTAAQAAEVRVLMRKAGVTPQAATASPGSAVVRSIAGPAVRRIAPVTKLAGVPVADSAQATGRGYAAGLRKLPWPPWRARLRSFTRHRVRREGKSRVVSKMLLRTPAAVTTEK